MPNITLDTQGLRWFDDSPDAGDPRCLCSHCGRVIQGGFPIRMWTEQEPVLEARFHDACFRARRAPPAPSAPKTFRKDGWPLCPKCDEDELWSPFHWDGEGERPPMQAWIDAGLTCYKCGWSNR